MMATKKGPLETKLKPRYVPRLASQAEQLEVIKAWQREDHEKLTLLCEELGIVEGPSRFYDLSLTLARKLYAGFQQAEPLSKWTDVTRGYLVVEIERLVSETGSVKVAADRLALRPEWKSFLNQTRHGGEGLRVQYQKFKGDRWSSIMRKAFAYHVQQNTLAEWQEDLLEALQKPHPFSYL